VPLVKLLPLKCVSLVPNIDLELHTALVMPDSMKMELPALHVEWNVKPVTTLIPVSLVPETELNQKTVAHVHITIVTSEKISAQLVLMLVPNVT
jgi:hypothetical protein